METPRIFPSHQNTKESTLSHQWPSWTKIYVRRKERKKNKKETIECETKRKGSLEDVFKCPPTKPNLHYNLFLSLIEHVPRNTLLQDPKKSHLHHCLSKEQYFSPSYVGFLGFFVLVRVSQRKQESENLLTSSSLSSFSHLCFHIRLSFPLSSRFVLYLIPSSSLCSACSLLYILWLSSLVVALLFLVFWVCLLFVDLMKKMKGIVPMESPSYVVYEDQRAMFRHQSLLQDYEELQKVKTLCSVFKRLKLLLWVPLDLVFCLMILLLLVDFGLCLCFCLRNWWICWRTWFRDLMFYPDRLGYLSGLGSINLRLICKTGVIFGSVGFYVFPFSSFFFFGVKFQ